MPCGGASSAPAAPPPSFALEAECLAAAGLVMARIKAPRHSWVVPTETGTNTENQRGQDEHEIENTDMSHEIAGLDDPY